ncbi:MAG: hypothetical protein AAGI88_02835 [Pseudomonadota bacterium]
MFRRSETLNRLRWCCVAGIGAFAIAAVIYHPHAAPLWLGALVLGQRMITSLDPDSLCLLPPIRCAVSPRGSNQQDALGYTLTVGEPESPWFSRIDKGPLVPCTVTCLARATGFMWLEVSPIVFESLGQTGGIGPPGAGNSARPVPQTGVKPSPDSGWWASLLLSPRRSQPSGRLLVFADAMNEFAWRSLRRDLKLPSSTG